MDILKETDGEEAEGKVKRGTWVLARDAARENVKHPLGKACLQLTLGAT